MFIYSVSAFFISFFSVPFYRKLAKKYKILDIPNKRKVHKNPVPLLGGLSIFSAVILCFLFFYKNLKPITTLIFASSFIVIVGLINDKKKLSALARLIVQVFSALIFIIFCERISFLPTGFLGNILEIIISLVWIVGITNAYNYLDGLDGLASSLAVINSFYFVIMFFCSGQYNLAFFCLIFLFSCLGFLPYNFKNASIFLGDTGSTFLGFILACLAILGNWAEDNIVKITIPILILGIPIFDMTFTTIMRIKERKVKNIIQWLEYADKDHFHHYLVSLGFSSQMAVFFIILFAISLGISAIMLSNDKAFEAFLTLTQATILFIIIGVLLVIGRKYQEKKKEVL
ncbi:MAG: undecaprenyl/decaprenyl-phosphate alpha-N-acetylglucosaminyl 1-phosphate transferase [Candidatus Omnitrophica bacterium]|nr:undecaprenyl/decaprenyl-phosphate alpha-N-acetylglucosaminyl 1-phosphate transferase [Candidatus Omnitrophota bacterium]